MYSTLHELFTSGRIIDVILMIVIAEMIVLSLWRIRRGAGPSVIAIIANLGAGAGLLLAFRSALNDSSWLVTAAFLGVALIAHVIDMVLRWRQTSLASTVSVADLRGSSLY